MKQGLNNGYKSSCCHGFHVWGSSSNAPDVTNGSITEHGNIENYQSLDFVYDSHHWVNEYGITVVKDAIPEEWPYAASRTWTLYAAKVPACYPGVGCDKYPAISSSEDGGDGSWSVDLGAFMNKSFRIEGDTEIDSIPWWKYVLGTRVTYVDGKQKYVTYRISAENVDSQGRSSVHINGGGPVTPSAIVFGDHYVIDIDSQSYNKYRVETVNNRIFTNPEDTGVTRSEILLRGFRATNILNNGISNTENCQYAAQQICCGKEYFLMSSYTPSKETNGSHWQLVRIKYSGNRLGVPGELEVFATLDDLGDSETVYSGDYVICLPSVRTYIDSTAPQPDECWVVAKTVSGTPKIVTGRWLQSNYRPGYGDEAQFDGAADGTLAPSEVENVILDASVPPSGYEDVSWENIEIRCYNHMYGKDTVLFTTHPTTPSGETATPLADFETNSLNHGLEDANMEFDTNGSVGGNIWRTDTTFSYGGITYSTDTPDGGSYFAVADSNVAFEGETNLSITFTVTTAGNLTFRYSLDNRRLGDRDSGDPFSELSNLPEVDNNLQIWVDGALLTTIDNSTFTLETEFLGWYDYSISLSPGTHTVRWTVQRVWANDRLIARLDNIQFPELLISNDVNGYRRWYYDGTRIREATNWSWARHDEEDSTELAGRASTQPDFITFDTNQDILYGNPHFVVKILMESGREGELDRTFGSSRGDNFEEGGGYVRFTASPNIEAPEPPCWALDLNPVTDQISDPPWGAFQILPVFNGFQIRGANANLRDATVFPIDKDLYTFKHPRTHKPIKEQFKEYLSVTSPGLWSMRANCWTITDNGKFLLPHVEVIWRPTLHQPAWPEASGAWTNPPYRTDFKNSTSMTDWWPYSVRPRNILFLSTGESTSSDKPRWGMNNTIIARTYSDAWSRIPQTIWVRNTDDPPSDPDDPNWWNPDWDTATIAGLQSPPDVFPRGGPWGSAIWRLLLGRFNPHGRRYMDFYTDVSISNVCDVHEEGVDPIYTGSSLWDIRMTNMYGFTDFDVVDCNDCDCCG